MDYTRHVRATQGEQALPSQVENSAGGFSFEVDDWTRLDRFLVLGTEGGSYYADERALSRENAAVVERCIEADGPRAVAQIVAVSDEGRAPKNDAALFALAMCAKLGDEETRAKAWRALPKVARIGTHLFQMARNVEAFGGWGRGTRRAFSLWYEEMPIEKLAYQLVKYQQRDGWSHRDLLRLCHPEHDTKERAAAYDWATSGPRSEAPGLYPEMILAFEGARGGKRHTLDAIALGLPREAVPTELLTDPEVWEALLQNMPMTAMIRNLATMTRLGLLAPMSDAAAVVAERLADPERIKKARIHPLSVLVALRTYASGESVRGSQTWDPVAQVIDALDGAFYLAFGNVVPADKRTMLALDVSGSMGGGEIAGMAGISPRIGSAAMALITAATEKRHQVCGFSGNFIDLAISPRQRLDDAIRVVSGLPFQRTDCALPMLKALERGLEIDTFVIYTDSETWAGHVHPYQALRDYRQKTGIRAKLVVVGMVANGFSIADPNDAGMLDVVGFDTATPNIISDFSRA